jgi:hypothetical protein
MCKFVTVTISPEDVDALSNVILAAVSEDASTDAEAAYKWLAYARECLYKEWKALPSGSHLKAAYEDDVWAWNDADIVPTEVKKV